MHACARCACRALNTALSAAQVAQYYAPTLSALQLFAAPPPGAASGFKPRLIFEYFERAPPFARKPLSDTLADLAAATCSALTTLSTAELHARSFVAICWQPICRIPLGRVFREVSASFITYHHLCAGAVDAPVPPSCPAVVREALRERLAAQQDAALLPAFGLLALKLNAEQWLGGGEPRFQSELAAACTRWMAPLGSRHGDYHFYSASSASSG